jgi:hypothetical protein
MKLFLARLVLWVLCVGGFLGFNVLIYFSADGGHSGWDALVGFYLVTATVAGLAAAGYWALKTIRDQHKHKG